MKTTSTHSVLPWRANGSQITARGDWKAPVAVVLSKADPRPTPDAAAVTREEADLNRDFIIRACNAHADLVEALADAVRAFDFTVSAMAKGQTVSISSLQNCAANARAAIAKATA